MSSRHRTYSSLRAHRTLPHSQMKYVFIDVSPGLYMSVCVCVFRIWMEYLFRLLHALLLYKLQG